MHNSECTTSLTKATKYADKRAPVPSVVFVVSFERERNSSVVRIWEHGTKGIVVWSKFGNMVLLMSVLHSGPYHYQ